MTRTTPLNNNPFLIFIVLMLLYVPGAVQAKELLLLTFAEGPTDSRKTYRTSTKIHAPVLSVVEGQQVIWQKTGGRDYTVQAVPHGWTWFQVQQVSRDETCIALTPFVEGDKVTVEVDYYIREGEQSMNYRSTIEGVTGQWIPLYQPTTNSQTDGQKVYTTGDAHDQLAMKVDVRHK